MTDVVSTAGVLVGRAAGGGDRLSHQLDAILAALVGLTILWSGWQLIRRASSG